MEAKLYEDKLDMNCDQIIDAHFHLEDLIIEKASINACKKQIEIRNKLSKEELSVLEEAANPVYQLFCSRLESQYIDKPMTLNEYCLCRQYENQIPELIMDLKESEEEQSLIKSDKRQLEVERDSFIYLSDEINDKKKSLHLYTISTAVMTITADVFLYVLGKIYNINLLIPMIAAFLIGACVCVWFFLAVKQTKKELAAGKRRQDRASVLLEKMKTKDSNKKLELDYIYLKYNIRNQRDLAYLWNNYKVLKHQERVNKEYKNAVSEYMAEFMERLEEMKFKDISLLANMPQLFIVEEDLIVFKDKLEIQMEKLEEALQFNKSISQTCTKEVKQILKNYPEYKEHVSTSLAEFDIKKEIITDI